MTFFKASSLKQYYDIKRRLVKLTLGSMPNIAFCVVSFISEWNEQFLSWLHDFPSAWRAHKWHQIGIGGLIHCLIHIYSMFSKLSETKLKKGIFVRPVIRKLLKDPLFVQEIHKNWIICLVLFQSNCEKLFMET